MRRQVHTKTSFTCLPVYLFVYLCTCLPCLPVSFPISPLLQHLPCHLLKHLFIPITEKLLPAPGLPLRDRVRNPARLRLLPFGVAVDGLGVEDGLGEGGEGRVCAEKLPHTQHFFDGVGEEVFKFQDMVAVFVQFLAEGVGFGDVCHPTLCGFADAFFGKEGLIRGAEAVGGALKVGADFPVGLGQVLGGVNETLETVGEGGVAAIADDEDQPGVGVKVVHQPNGLAIEQAVRAFVADDGFSGAAGLAFEDEVGGGAHHDRGQITPAIPAKTAPAEPVRHVRVGDEGLQGRAAGEEVGLPVAQHIRVQVGQPHEERCPRPRVAEDEEFGEGEKRLSLGDLFGGEGGDGRARGVRAAFAVAEDVEGEF